MLARLHKPLKIPLRLFLVVPLVLQIVAVTGVTGYLSWRNGHEAVAELADRLMDQTTKRIVDRLDNYLQTPHQILELNRLAWESGDLDLTDFQELERYFWQQINVFDRIAAIAFGNEQGQSLGFGIDRGGVLGVANAKVYWEVNLSDGQDPETIEFYLLDELGDRVQGLKSIPNYDPRKIHWYQTAQKAGKQTWTPIVPYFTVPKASLFAVTPVEQDGQFQGVMFVSLMLDDISRFLNSLEFSPSGQTFIIERSGDLVATSTEEQPFVRIEALDLKRLPGIDSQDALTQKAIQSLGAQHIDLSQIKEKQCFQFRSDRQQHFAQITPYEDRYGLDWLIVAIVPESDFAAEIAANTRDTLWLCLGVMGISVAIGTAIAEWIARSIRTLSENSVTMAEGNLNQQMPEKLGIVEIDRMAGSFNQMATQLHQSFEFVQTALKESEAKYTTIFRNSPDPIGIISIDKGCLMDVNPSFLELTGYPRNEVIGHTVAELNLLVNPKQIVAIGQKLQKTGIVRNQEIRWRHKSGDIKISLVSCEIIQLDGQPYVLSITKEISELKRTQAALVESEAKLRQLSENIPLFFGLWSAQTDRWLYVSPGFEQITGGKVQEMYDRPLAWQQYIHPDDREALLAKKPSPDSTEPWSEEFRIVRSDGALRWLHSTLYPVRNETGEIYRVCTIAEDISDRKCLELALQSSERKLNELINTPIAAIVRIQIFPNRDWQLDYVSQGSEAIFGYTADEFIADRSIWMANIFPEDVESTILPLFEDIFEEKTTQFEYRFIHKDGHFCWLSAQFTSTYDPAEECWFVNQFTVDISDRKQAEIALEQAKEAAEAANRAKTEFLANISHEIRTPLNAIMVFSELLFRQVSNPEHRDRLNNIISSGKTLLALINDILDLSKIESQKIFIHHEPVQLIKLISEIQAIFKQQAYAKKIRLFVEILEEVPQIILFDEVRLRQILFNVVGNALKFTEQGYVRIRVNARPCETTTQNHIPTQVHLEIQVEDTGIGIAPEQQEKIFEAFIQSDGQSTRKYGGTGLGLAITKRLTNLLGGTVNLTSELGTGSIFSFNFSQVEVLESGEPIATSSKLDEDLNQFKPTTILVVDDVESNLDLIASYFLETKHHLLFAKDGIEAMNHVARLPPDLILLDLWMPNMNGLEVAESLKNNPSTEAIPIIFITASCFQEDRDRIKSLCNGFIRKPVTIDRLVLQLKNIFNLDNIFVSISEKSLQDKQDSFEFSLTPEILSKRPELFDKLQQQATEVWPELCRLQKQREIKEFIAYLDSLAKEYQCKILLDYANKLKIQVEGFDWDNLPNTLENFPKIIAKIHNELKEIYSYEI